MTLQPGEENDVRKARSTSFACHRTSWLSSPLTGNGSKSSTPRACIDGEGTSNEMLEKVGRPLSGVNRSARGPAPRPFASFLLPLGALPGPRLRAVASYAHSPPRLRHVLHLGLSPLQPSFLPEKGITSTTWKEERTHNTQAPATYHERRSKALTSTKIARNFRLLPEPT